VHVWPPDPSPGRTFLLQSIRQQVNAYLEGRRALCEGRVRDPLNPIEVTGVYNPANDSCIGRFGTEILPVAPGPTRSVILTFQQWLLNPPPPGTPFPHAGNSTLRLTLAAVAVVAATVVTAGVFTVATAAIIAPAVGLVATTLTVQEENPISNQEFQADLNTQAEAAGITVQSIAPAAAAIPKAATPAIVVGALVLGFLFLG